jgi:hypothetical protein
LNGIFIDAANTVVDEARTEQNRQSEDSAVMGGVFIKRAKPLGINDEDVNIFPFWRLADDWATPDPETLGSLG